MGQLVMTQIDGETIAREKLDEPGLFRVLMHNDDRTTMDFVVDILCRVFNKSQEDAYDIMMRVHTNGIGVCGVYPREIAETRIARVHQAAWRAGFPLKCTMEKE